MRECIGTAGAVEGGGNNITSATAVESIINHHWTLRIIDGVVK
jgi:hypothetical protein